MFRHPQSYLILFNNVNILFHETFKYVLSKDFSTYLKVSNEFSQRMFHADYCRCTQGGGHQTLNSIDAWKEYRPTALATPFFILP